MERFYSVRVVNYALMLSAMLVVSSVAFIQHSQALTASYGRPYHGSLEDGVVFPSQFPGYHLRDPNRSYTTPEVVGALLDAVEAVRTQFPDTCDIFIGDFSVGGGGSAIHHRSHQNGRDVDIGMYAKGNRPLDTFVSMSEENLDAAKTWCLIENIIRSQRVQYIFLDRRVQKVLYDYALTRGYDQPYLDRVFGNVRGSLLQHVRNHVDHMHVRFFTPWSTLAAHIGNAEAEKRAVVEMAQQSYLPKKVNYYVNGSEQDLDDIAKSFGVSKRDLCKWNRISPSAVPVPGSCLVFYKRSFESEPVHLARSIQPGFIAQAPPIRMASLRTESPAPTVVDTVARAEVPREEPEVPTPKVEEKKTERLQIAAPHKVTQPVYYKIQKGDTLLLIAKRTKVGADQICRLNGITKTTKLMPGQTIKTGTKTIVVADAAQSATDAPKKKSSSSSSPICFSSDPKKPNSPTAAFYTVGKGDTLQKISRKSGISIDVLCQLNGLKRTTRLKTGQKIKLTQANLPVKPPLGNAACKIPVPKAHTKPEVKGKPAAPSTKPPQEAKAAVKAAPKAAAKAAPGKAGLKVVAASKKNTKSIAKQPAKRTVASKAAVVKPPPGAQKNKAKKAVEAKNAVKPAPAKNMHHKVTQLAKNAPAKR